MKRLSLVLVAAMLATSPAYAQERTQTYCDSYAKVKSGSSATAAGATTGIVGGAALGGIVNGSKGAKRGAVTGGLIGGINGNAADKQKYNHFYHHCLSGKAL
ncbi:hypothetical protein [uncultured Shimia sp.]|uniref:hypothetical protein n=1 Tax=uncultured Shimia sp. TaxID=573152 RepID=UPI002607EDBD|nr:hypothetical protein [uncultured Shimia sp.]